jgi:hypothetical protein
LEEGWAHGSRAIDLVIETRDISLSRTTDDNARRQAGLYALHDWCCGQDAQWLMAGPESEFHSHDHGFYLSLCLRKSEKPHRPLPAARA